MSVSQAYLSPAATPDNMMASPSGQQPIPAPEDSESKLRADIERTLLQISQNLYELEVCAGDVSTGQEDRVPAYMQEVNKGLIQLSEMAGRLHDTVPQQVVDYIDNYRNPHMYTRSAISRATGENQYALGRVLGLESFRRQLEESIGTEFPTIPLPPRKHQPVLPNGVATSDQNRLNGSSGQNGDPALQNGDLKAEHTNQETGLSNGQSTANSDVQH